jgi:hypothetical protein
MNGKVASAPAVARLMILCLAVGQAHRTAWAQTDSRTGAAEPGPVIAVSPNVLDFGLVGVGRTKELTLTVQNVGGGTLKGTATVAAPFRITGNAYSLRSGQSRSFKVRYSPAGPGTNREPVVFSEGSAVTVLATGSARTPPQPPGKLHVVTTPSSRFTEEAQADLIVKYYSDPTSYLLKPPQRDSQFFAVYDRGSVLNLAAQQPRRELAVVELIHYPGGASEEPVKLGWVNDLKGLGYERIVFLRGNDKVQANGLPVLQEIRVRDLPAAGAPQASTMSVEK